jgi:hypothetical protein
MNIKEQLEASIPRQCVSERKGLSYVTGRYVKQRLNEIFNWDGWSYKIIEQRMLSLDEEAVRWLVHLRLRVAVDGGRTVYKDGIAVGHGTMKDRYSKPLSPGRANEVIDFAAAEAVTDALKRAAVSLGQNLGLELYPMNPDDKQAATEESEPKPPPVDEKKAVKRFVDSIAGATTMGGLSIIGKAIAEAGLSEAAKAQVRGIYAGKAHELEVGDE